MDAGKLCSELRCLLWTTGTGTAAAAADARADSGTHFRWEACGSMGSVES